MAKRYVVVPAWVLAGLHEHPSPEMAAVAAAKLVEKDGVPRVVVMPHANVRAGQTPRVDIVHLD